MTEYDDLKEFDDIAALLRSVTDEDRERLDPPADLWSAIEESVAEADGATATPAPPISLAERRNRRLSPLLAAAAMVAIVAGAIGLWVGTDRGDGATKVAATPLENLLPGYAGEATLIDHDGELTLELELADLPAADGYYEVWLIKDLETGEMQSLGPIDSAGSVDLPAGLDPAAYRIVDISIEPLDGVPTHSGASVLRGELT